MFSFSSEQPERPPLRARPAWQVSSNGGHSTPTTSSDSESISNSQSGASQRSWTMASSPESSDASNNNWKGRKANRGGSRKWGRDGWLAHRGHHASGWQECQDRDGWQGRNGWKDSSSGWQERRLWKDDDGWQDHAAWRNAGAVWRRKEVPVCCYFLEGKCVHGNSCWWLHPKARATADHKPQSEAGRSAATLAEVTRCRFGGLCRFGHGRKAWMKASHPDDERLSQESTENSDSICESRVDQEVCRFESIGLSADPVEGDSDKENREKDIGVQTPEKKSTKLEGPNRVAALAIRAILQRTTNTTHKEDDPPNGGSAPVQTPKLAKSLTTWDRSDDAEKALRMLRGDWSSLDLQGRTWLHKVCLEWMPCRLGSEYTKQLLFVAWSTPSDVEPTQWQWKSISYKSGNIMLGPSKASVLLAVSSNHATWVNEEQNAPPVIWGRGW